MESKFSRLKTQMQPVVVTICGFSLSPPSTARVLWVLGWVKTSCFTEDTNAVWFIINLQIHRLDSSNFYFIQDISSFYMNFIPEILVFHKIYFFMLTLVTKNIYTYIWHNFNLKLKIKS